MKRANIIILIVLSIAASGCSLGGKLLGDKPGIEFNGGLTGDAVKKICISSAPKATIQVKSVTGQIYTNVPSENDVFEMMFSDDHPFADKWQLSGDIILPDDCTQRTAIMIGFLRDKFPRAAIGYAVSNAYGPKIIRKLTKNGHMVPCIVTRDKGLVYIEPATNELIGFGWRADRIVIAGI